MGSFGGHALPGTFFVFVGLWHVYFIIKRYFQNNKNHVCQPYFIVTICGRRTAIESYIIVTSCTLGIALEIITLWGGEAVHLAHAQHCIMFAMFGLVGAIQALQYHGCRMPPMTVRAIVLLALVIEALLFAFHVHLRDTLDVKVHMILVYTVCCTAFFVIFEMFNPTVLIWSLFRASLLILQGTWFWQVAFVLYAPVGPKWDHESHLQLMYLPMIFAAHTVAILFVVTVIWMYHASKHGGLCNSLVDGSQPHAYEALNQEPKESP